MIIKCFFLGLKNFADIRWLSLLITHDTLHSHPMALFCLARAVAPQVCLLAINCIIQTALSNERWTWVCTWAVSLVSIFAPCLSFFAAWAGEKHLMAVRQAGWLIQSQLSPQTKARKVQEKRISSISSTLFHFLVALVNLSICFGIWILIHQLPLLLSRFSFILRAIQFMFLSTSFSLIILGSDRDRDPLFHLGFGCSFAIVFLLTPTWISWPVGSLLFSLGSLSADFDTSMTIKQTKSNILYSLFSSIAGIPIQISIWMVKLFH